MVNATRLRQKFYIVGSTGSRDATSITTDLKGFIQRGLYSDITTLPDLEPSCASGNCSFPSYSSVAVCTTFANVSSHLKFSKFYHPEVDPDRFTARYNLTDNSYLEEDNDAQAYFNISSAVSTNPKYDSQNQRLYFTESIAFRNVTAPIADLFVIYKGGHEDDINFAVPSTTSKTGRPVHGGIGAVEVLLEWCLQEFSTDVVNGSVNTKKRVTRTYMARTLLQQAIMTSVPTPSTQAHIQGL
jgi:hypothetical protein